MVSSAAASSAYLTVSEVFPLEIRAFAIAIFYAVGTALGGFVAPALFGLLIASGERTNVFAGYAMGATRHMPEYLAFGATLWIFSSVVWGRFSLVARTLRPPPIFPKEDLPPHKVPQRPEEDAPPDGDDEEQTDAFLRSLASPAGGDTISRDGLGGGKGRKGGPPAVPR